MCNRFFAHFLALAHVHLRLKHVIHERIAPRWALIKVFRFLKCGDNELVSQRERTLNLHTVVVFNVDLQILCTYGPGVLKMIRNQMSHIYDMRHTQML